ncbi:family 1 glycosylhydrolase [Corynebacterium sp. 3HC-13]|uniref:family 1 glycosylhydrolase n=1 Tax=Corynebacterium poyangense TaxID=2684405 RepID=UPI001CC9A0E3|nr:family 1 glycosylhydrolase [Corynebacterium poyangense]MBZ8176356.1 family 1 glycosylhydrolase [Corynebacterium poyangense]
MSNLRARLMAAAALLFTLFLLPTSPAAAGGFAAAPTASPTFHWGVATSGFQVEGHNPDSNWKRYVDATAPTGKIDPVNDAVNFWERYPEDIQRAADMGVNTFRISVEWARIEPTPDQYDEAALAHYDDIINSIRAHGMTPMITMVHYVYPGWLADRGGFLSEDAIEHFGRFADLITQRWGGPGQDTLWVTFNEPLVFFGHEVEIGLINVADMPRFLDNIARAHRLGYEAAHRANPATMVTTNEAFLPAVTGITDTMLLNRVADALDYVGIDYYYGVAANNLTTINAAFGKFAAVRPQPEGIYEAIQHFAGAFPGKPIYIVENGMPTDNGVRTDGVERGDFIKDTVFWLQRARADGYNVIGYNHWSLVDNYEWGKYAPRFGLYTVDVLSDPQLTRRPSSGVDAYRQAIADGGVPADYHPVLPLAQCSASTIPDSCLNPPNPTGPRALLR